MLYRLKNIVKRFDQRNVLDLETLWLEKGRVIALLGPNGAGKTTLLEILAFLSNPTTGEFWFEDEKVDFAGGKLIDLRRRVVLVDQQPILFTTTVFKNVEFPLKLRRIQKERRAKIVTPKEAVEIQNRLRELLRLKWDNRSIERVGGTVNREGIAADAATQIGNTNTGVPVSVVGTVMNFAHLGMHFVILDLLRRYRQESPGPHMQRQGRRRDAMRVECCHQIRCEM